MKMALSAMTLLSVAAAPATQASVNFFCAARTSFSAAKELCAFARMATAAIVNAAAIAAAASVAVRRFFESDIDSLPRLCSRARRFYMRTRGKPKGKCGWYVLRRRRGGRSTRWNLPASHESLTPGKRGELHYGAESAARTTEASLALRGLGRVVEVAGAHVHARLRGIEA